MTTLTADAVLDFFRRQDGLGETPPNSNCNWLTQWYGMGCVPWCVIGVSRAIGEAIGNTDDISIPGVRRTTKKGWAYVPYIKQNFADAGLYITDTRAGLPGDFGICDWDGDGEGDHIVVVETRLDGGETYITRECNTSNNLCQQRRRSRSVFHGFCRPNYAGYGGPPIPAAPAAGFPAWPGRLLRYPPVTIGDDVAAWQQRLKDRGWREMAVDRAFGPTTRRLTLAFQKEKFPGQPQEHDGVVGDNTWNMGMRTDNVT